MQVAVAAAELQRLEYVVVEREVEGVEHVGALQLCEDQSVLHQLKEWHGRGHVVVRVRAEQGLVLVVAEDGGGQVVEGNKVRHDSCSILYMGNTQ